MKLNIFTSTIYDGVMSKRKEFYKNLNKEEIDTIYNINVSKFLSKYNLSSENIVVMNEKNISKASHTVTEKHKGYKDWILLLKENIKKLPILVESNDDPVLVGYAQDESGATTVAISIATIDNLNNNLINEMTEVLMKETDAPTFEMKFYIGPCPSKENYIVDKKKLTHKMFKKAVEEKDEKAYLDIRYAIFNELYLEIVDPNNIYFDSNDTVTSDKYYSKIGNKKGMQVTCVVFTDEEV